MATEVTNQSSAYYFQRYNDHQKRDLPVDSTNGSRALRFVSKLRTDTTAALPTRRKQAHKNWQDWLIILKKMVRCLAVLVEKWNTDNEQQGNHQLTDIVSIERQILSTKRKNRNVMTPVNRIRFKILRI